MPHSGSLLDSKFTQMVEGIRPFITNVLDIGSGACKYAKLIRANPTCKDMYLQAIEIEKDYLQTFASDYRLYDDILIGNAYEELQKNVEQTYDLVIMGDVIEHMPKSDGIDLLNFLVYRCQYLYIQYPNHYVQNCLDGYRSEAHISIWGLVDFENFEVNTFVQEPLVVIMIDGYLRKGPSVCQLPIIR
jgi:hypothetical protein